MAKTLMQISPDREVLVARMRRVEVGQTFGYAEASALIGRPVEPGSKGYAVYHGAKRTLENEGYVWGCVPKTGYMRLAAECDKARSAGSRHRAARAMRRAHRLTKTVLDTATDLSPDARKALLIEASITGALAHASGERAAQQIALKVDTAQLAINATLAAICKE